jgi:hypothetical protein
MQRVNEDFGIATRRSGGSRYLSQRDEDSPVKGHPRFRVCLACVATMVLLSSCTKVGPKSIRNTRFDYNAAIIDTRNEQMLANLVRLRYRDNPYCIEVSSIATQYVLGVAGSASVGGIGGPDSKAVGGVGEGSP